MNQYHLDTPIVNAGEVQPSRRSFVMTFFFLFIAVGSFLFVRCTNNQPVNVAPVVATVNSPFIRAATPTLIAISPTPGIVTPTPTTPAPTSTATVRPSNTPWATATIQVQPTQDIAYLRDVEEVKAQARAIKLEQDRQEIEIAWERVKLGGAVALMVIGVVVLFIAIVTAYIRTLRGDFKKPATMPVDDTAAAQDEEIEPTPYDDMPCDENTLTEWCKLIDWTTGKMPQEAAVDKMFGGQDKYREKFLPWLSRWKFAAKSKRDQWYVTIHFSNWIGVKFTPHQPDPPAR